MSSQITPPGSMEPVKAMAGSHNRARAARLARRAAQFNKFRLVQLNLVPLVDTFVSVVFFVALLIGYPWHMLSIGSVLYLASLPWGWKTYRDHERNAAAAAAAQPPPATADAAAPSAPTATFSPVAEDPDDERPVRLN